MKKFMAKITSKLQDQEIPPLRYSDLYISKENDSSFWVVAESLIGQFQKFNDNFYLFGYINPDQSFANHLAQCFSLYTQWYEYMINDIQAVGYNYIDTTINTKEGEFHDIDKGSEGIVQYIKALFESKKKYQFKKLLEVLGLENWI